MNQPASEPADDTNLPATAEAESSTALTSYNDTDKRMSNIHKTREELLKRLGNYTSEHNITDLPPDLLNGRYIIRCDQPLHELSYGKVKTYAVTDNKGSETQLYAAVSDITRPYVERNLEKLSSYENQHTVRLIDHGRANISALNEYRYVFIFEQPRGISLARLMADGVEFTENRFINRIAKPIAEIITAFEHMGIQHARINPKNIFINEKELILGECITEPPGFSQETIYEPMERLCSLPAGLGGGTIKTDIYALGILAIDVIGNLTRYRDLPRKDYITLLLQNGTYNTLAGKGKFSPGFHDLLIGALNEAPDERWNSETLNIWLGGKRFNLLRPGKPHEASRPFEFNGEEFYSPRALAYSLYRNWSTAASTIRKLPIGRWFEQGMNKKEKAEIVERVILTTGGSDSQNPRQNNELLSRIITLLDPGGPIRLEDISFNMGGIGILAVDAIHDKNNHELSLVQDIINFDLSSFWADLQEHISNTSEEMIWRLEKIRHFLRSKGLGFGTERMLYNLNPQLPCLSTALRKYHLADKKDLILALDQIVSEQPDAISLTDRHLNAFMANRAFISKEVTVKECQHHTKIIERKELIALIILARLQEKTGEKKLKGLAYWAALQLLPLVEDVHSLRTRGEICQDLILTSERGHIGSVLQCLVNAKILNRDLNGVQKASILYRRNKNKIDQLNNQKRTKERAERTGRTIAAAIASSVLGLVIYILVKQHANF